MLLGFKFVLVCVEVDKRDFLIFLSSFVRAGSLLCASPSSSLDISSVDELEEKIS